MQRTDTLNLEGIKALPIEEEQSATRINEY